MAAGLQVLESEFIPRQLTLLLRDEIVLYCLLTFIDLLLYNLGLPPEALVLLALSVSVVLVLLNEINGLHGVVDHLKGELGFLVGALLVLVDQVNLLVVTLLKFAYFLFLQLLFLQQMSNLRV